MSFYNTISKLGKECQGYILSPYLFNIFFFFKGTNEFYFIHIWWIVSLSSVTQSCTTLWPHESQHTYLTSMQSKSWEMLDWMKHKLESRLPGEISITSDMQMTPPLWQKAKKNQRASWWKWKESEKVGLKLSIQKTKIMASGPIASWQIDGETGKSDRLFFWAPN